MMRSLIVLFLIGTIAVHGQDSYEVQELSIKPRAMDYAPIFYNDGFVMCSMRQLTGMVNYEQENSFLPFADMYYVPLDSSGAGKPSLFSERFVSPVHDGPASFTSDGKTICFTRNLDVPDGLKDQVGKNNRLGLYFANKIGDTWEEPHVFDWNHEEFSSMHPSFSSDGQMLFFASDIPGGFGGSDIYVCYREGANDWSLPMNLGPNINSLDNELFPFIHASGILYFSSNRPGGIGGIDIYESLPAQGGFAVPMLLPEPVNSKGDDLGICFRDDHRDGLFSSNRKGLDRIYRLTRKAQPFKDCVPMEENSYCYTFEEEGTFESDTLPLMYQWDLGDGTVSASLTVDHCYRGPGSYVVKLNIIDTLTNSIFFNEATYDLVIEDIQQPFINIEDTVPVGEPLTFDGSRSNLAGFTINDFIWDLGGGKLASGPSIVHTFPSLGDHELKMEIIGSQDGGSVPQRHCVTKKVAVVDMTTYEQAMVRKSDKLRLSGGGDQFSFHQLPFDQFIMAIKEGEDVFFTVELFASAERIPLSSPLFDRVRPHFPILERYVAERKMFSYSVGKSKNLASTYNVYKFMKDLKFMDAEVMVMVPEKLRDADGLANMELDFETMAELNNTVVRVSTVFFGYRQKMFEPQFETHLEKMLLILEKFPRVEMVIGAHTDATGSDQYNLDLSIDRAQNVQKYFLDNGIHSDRLKSIGFGEDHPIADNSTEEGQGMNRRVEFKLVLPQDAVAEGKTK